MRNIAAAAPVDTGRLRRSAQATVALLHALEDASYGRFLEYGTAYIEPRNFIAPQLSSPAQVAQAVWDAFNASTVLR